MTNAAKERRAQASRMLASGCVALFLGALTTVPAAAAGEMTACRTAKLPEARIDACSAVIRAGTASTADRAEAFRRRGDAHAARTAYREADADYTEALRLEPASVPALTGRASARLASGDNIGAVSDLTDALRIDGGSAGLFVARGYARLLQENADEAVADFTAALAK